MVGDSEFNICTEEHSFTQAARKRVWGNLAGSGLNGFAGSPTDMSLTFEAWGKRMSNNLFARTRGDPPEKNSFIHPFADLRLPLNFGVFSPGCHAAFLR